MNKRNSIFCRFRTFCVLALLATTSNPASAAIKAGVLGGASAATASLAVEAAKLTAQGSQDIIAALNGEAWTWDTASEVTNNDTTLFPEGKVVAEAEAHSRHWWGNADAKGSANKITGAIIPTAKSSGWAAAKSLAGVGNKYESDGSGWLAVILAKIVGVALDPEPIPLGLPADGSIPSSFQYNIGLSDPLGQQFSLLNVSANMVFDPLLRDWTLEIHDSSNTLSQSDFSRTVNAGGAVTYALKSSVEFEIPFAVPSSWSAGSSFVLDTTGEVAVQSVGPVPEPETYAMFLAGLGLLGFVARQRKGQQVLL